MAEVDPERSEAMVGEALDGLPAQLGELMSNVAVTVEHNEGPVGLRGSTRGVPLTRLPQPDREPGGVRRAHECHGEEEITGGVSTVADDEHHDIGLHARHAQPRPRA
jgi:hypothetical protein